MSPEERAEVREMMTDILSGHAQKSEGQYRVILAQLSNIEIQTTKTNSRVTHLEEEKQKYLETRVDTKMLKEVLNDIEDIKLKVERDIPHTIDSCPQQTTIVELRDNMITTEALKKANRNAIIATGVVVSIIFSLTMLLINIHKIIGNGAIGN